MSKIKVRPFGPRILVKREEEQQKTASGIYLPETAKEEPQWGKVMAVGTGRKLEDGKVQPVEVKEGATIIFGKYSGTKVKIDDEELLFMNEDDILAVVEA